MDSARIFEPNELDGSTFLEKVNSLIKQQKETWSLAAENYEDLSNIRKKTFDFEDFKIEVQFNPGRIVSSSAKVDSKSIEERPCFLCSDNLPQEQKGLRFGNEYMVLVNPFPIFSEHFTIPTFAHKPQEIESSFADMLSLAKALNRNYSLFYNGPKCGASAPDHLHFQTCPSGILPIEYELENTCQKNGSILFESSDSRLISVQNYLRNFYLIDSKNDASTLALFNNFAQVFKGVILSDEEPMMNIISYYNNGWKTIIFPREQHRPYQYFLEDDQKLLISPAAVDFGGQLITPREMDFEKLTKENVVDIFKQTTLDEYKIEKINEAIKRIDLV